MDKRNSKNQPGGSKSGGNLRNKTGKCENTGAGRRRESVGTGRRRENAGTGRNNGNTDSYQGLNHIGSWLGLIAWPLALIIGLIAKNNPETAEKVFAQGIFKGYAAVMSRLTGTVPFSLAEILLILFVLGIVAAVTIAVIRIIKYSDSRFLRTVRFVKNLLVFAGIIFLVYMIGCGTNYYRYEFAEYSNLKIEKSSTQELYELCMYLAQRANETEEEAKKVARSDDELAAAARDAMELLGCEYEVLSGYYPLPKQVFFSRTMSSFGITGVYFPWTVEANVNTDVTFYSHGSTMCHELSHLRGFMREDEANYIAFLACEISDDVWLNYSGYMLALINAGNRLYSDDKELYFEVVATYSDGVRADLKKNNEYWEAFRDTAASNAGEKINNAYLKANSIEDGTKSYGRMVDLLLARFRQVGLANKP